MPEIETSHLARYGTGPLRPVVCGECGGSGTAIYDASWKDTCQDWDDGDGFGMRRFYDVVRGPGGAILRDAHGKRTTRPVGVERAMVCRRCGSFGIVLIGEGAYGRGQAELAEREAW